MPGKLDAPDVIAPDTQSAADPHLAEWANVLFDQAVLTLGARIEEPAAFVSRLNDLLVTLTDADETPPDPDPEPEPEPEP